MVPAALWLLFINALNFSAMKKCMLVVWLFIVVATSRSQNTIQLGWDFNGNSGNEIAVAASLNNVNIEVASIVRGQGLTPAALSNSFSSGGWTITNSLADAIANNDYLQFSVKAKSSFVVSLSALDAVFRRSSTGPDHFQWQYSDDGILFYNIGNEISFTSTATNGVAQASLDLSGIAALQSVMASVTITIRLYGYNATAAGGSFSLGRLAGNDLALAGSAHSITPVRIINFNAVNKNNSVLLKWITATEINSSRFEIEHSKDGKRFFMIGSMKSENADGGAGYFFLHNDLVAGENFYRLRIVDSDERFEFSNIILVTNQATTSLDVRLVSNGQLALVNHPVIDEPSKLKIMGIDGKIHRVAGLPAMTSKTTIDISNLPSGLFVMVWHSADKLLAKQFCKY